MIGTETQFMTLVDKFSSSDPDVILGKMMSAPALKHKEKVFAFYHNGEMGFRLGPKFDAQKFGIVDTRPLSPFKTKPPLKGWFIISEVERRFWEILTERALEFTKTLHK